MPNSTTSTTLGGTIWPRVPDAQITPLDSSAANRVAPPRSTNSRGWSFACETGLKTAGPAGPSSRFRWLSPSVPVAPKNSRWPSEWNGPGFESPKMLMSVRRSVPAVVPSVLQSSRPNLSSAEK